jgi:hypothetical protein
MRMQNLLEKHHSREGGFYSVNCFKSFLNKIQNLLRDSCEFRNICAYFDDSSPTCTISGGSHCGKHRELRAEKTSNKSIKQNK